MKLTESISKNVHSRVQLIEIQGKSVTEFFQSDLVKNPLAGLMIGLMAIIKVLSIHAKGSYKLINIILLMEQTEKRYLNLIF